jgi:hypothetical protein
MPNATDFRQIVSEIVSNDTIHAKWLNTLSMMENSGARKISKYEHPSTVTLIELKHAAEEARHAFYLKKLTLKFPSVHLPDYSFEHILAPIQSWHYLNMLDLQACKYLKHTLGLHDRALKHGAYLFVTYSIEVRADMLYGIYQEVLDEKKSKISVKSIIAEEEGHLAEMQKMLEIFSPTWEQQVSGMLEIENRLFNEWVASIASTL